MDKINILILTAFHNRPHISELYWMGIKRLRENFNIKTFAIVSDDENEKLALQHSDVIARHDNLFLGRKMNFGLRQAAAINFELLMQMGSDNLISNDGMSKNIDMFLNGNLFFGHNRILFYDTETKQAKQKFYGNVFGAGRCIARPMLIKALRKQQLWEDDRQRGLDMNSERTIEATVGLHPVPVEFAQPQLIDVKSKENIWAYDYFKEPKCDPEIMKGMISKQEYKYLMELPSTPEGEKTKTKIRI